MPKPKHHPEPPTLFLDIIEAIIYVFVAIGVLISLMFLPILFIAEEFSSAGLIALAAIGFFIWRNSMVTRDYTRGIYNQLEAIRTRNEIAKH